jgi:DNA gyrase subunit B
VELRQVDSHPTRVLVSKTEHGSITEKALPKEFFESAEYRRIVELGKTLAGLIGEGAYITRGDAREEIGSFKQAMTWLIDRRARASRSSVTKASGK